MKLAYIISAYKYPEQLLRLVQRLNNPAVSFFIHVDKKTDEKIYRQMVDQLSSLPNVYFLKRHKCYWGDFGHVKATIKGIEEALKRNCSFDYVFLLTGQDYPIKSIIDIEDFLQENKGKEFLEYFPLPTPNWQGNFEGMRRIERWHFRLFGKFLIFPEQRNFKSSLLSSLWSFLISLFPHKRKFPKGFQPFGGSGYWCLTRECITHVYKFITENYNFVNFFKFVYVPDEIFFQKIILNSPFKDNVINTDLRCIDWSGRGGSYPTIWCKDDLEKLRESTALIARKFDSNIDSDILDLIDQKILNCTRSVEIQKE